jgi:hypothetical protein
MRPCLVTIETSLVVLVMSLNAKSNHYKNALAIVKNVFGLSVFYFQL